MARYTFDQKLGASAMGPLLIRMQRLEFASWTGDALRRNRKTYVMGGQATLFNAAALRAVAERNHTRELWDTSTLVEDMQLTGDLQAMRYATSVSATGSAPALTRSGGRPVQHAERHARCRADASVLEDLPDR